MYIGCNWSKELRFLLEKDAVKVDYIKCGAFGNFEKEFLVMRNLRPVLVHGLGYFENAGMANMKIIDFDLANSIIKKCSSPHYGTHLAIRYQDMYEGMTEEAIYERMCRYIQTFKNNLKVPLLLENSPDTPHDRKFFDLYPYPEPNQIKSLVIDNEVFFLLDISHAKLTAKYNEINIFDYLKELPLERVKEIHVNGSGYDEDGLPMDTHQAMEKEDYKLLEWVINRTNPEIVTLEYNGTEKEDKDTIIENLKSQLTRIREIICL